MGRISFSVLFLLVLIHLGASFSSQNHPEPLSVFKDSSTFYTIRKPFNDRLVSAFESPESDDSNKVYISRETYSDSGNPYLADIYDGVTLPEVDSNDLEKPSLPIKDGEHESSFLSNIPSALQMLYSWKTLLSDVVDTVHKATRIYQDKKDELLLEVNETSGRAFASLPSALLDIVLSPGSLGELVEVGRSAESEDEVLQGLTSVMLKSEGRSGSSLTLDPVTVIALLTLAAYLIRAVYQILITNNNGRSFEHPSLLGVIDLPENIARILDTVTGSEYKESTSGRLARAADDESGGNHVEANASSGVLSLPGSVAAITKLRREGHGDCINLYTCEQLAHKNVFSYSLEDVLVVSMGAYLGDVKLWPLLNPKSTPEDLAVDRCGQYRGVCRPSTLWEARQLRDLFTEASSTLLRLLSNAREARRRSYARHSSARSDAHT